MVDDIDHIVQEWNIVWNEDKGIFIVLQVAFKPIDMLRIQVVGWLIQEKDIWFFKKQFSQKDLGPLPTWQGGHIRIHPKVHNPKSTRHFIDLGIQGIKITTF